MTTRLSSGADAGAHVASLLAAEHPTPSRANQGCWRLFTGALTNSRLPRAYGERMTLQVADADLPQEVSAEAQEPAPWPFPLERLPSSLIPLSGMLDLVDLETLRRTSRQLRALVDHSAFPAAAGRLQEIGRELGQIDEEVAAAGDLRTPAARLDRGIGWVDRAAKFASGSAQVLMVPSGFFRFIAAVGGADTAPQGTFGHTLTAGSDGGLEVGGGLLGIWIVLRCIEAKLRNQRSSLEPGLQRMDLADDLHAEVPNAAFEFGNARAQGVQALARTIHEGVTHGLDATAHYAGRHALRSAILDGKPEQVRAGVRAVLAIPPALMSREAKVRWLADRRDPAIAESTPLARWCTIPADLEADSAFLEAVSALVCEVSSSPVLTLDEKEFTCLRCHTTDYVERAVQFENFAMAAAIVTGLDDAKTPDARAMLERVGAAAVQGLAGHLKDTPLADRLQAIAKAIHSPDVAIHVPDPEGKHD